jgi:hypothetical protein
LLLTGGRKQIRKNISHMDRHWTPWFLGPA